VNRSRSTAPGWRRDALVQWARPANLARTPPPRRVVDPAQRRAEEFERARRHSRRVRLLRIGLPSVAATAIVALVAALVVSASRAPSIDLQAARLENGKLVMDNPVLSGSDDDQRPYRLTAHRAVQDAANPARVSLEAIDAVLSISDKSQAKIVAGAGIYDISEKTLNLSGSVSVDTDDGMRIRLQDADIDIAAGTLNTLNPVEVEMPEAVVTAESMRVDNRDKTIVFESRVRVTLYPARVEQAGDVDQ
jgi:lipopolysaccharide export system protein LptC